MNPVQISLFYRDILYYFFPKTYRRYFSLLLSSLLFFFSFPPLQQTIYLSREQIPSRKNEKQPEKIFIDNVYLKESLPLGALL